MMAPTGGMQAVVDALAAGLGERVRCGAAGHRGDARSTAASTSRRRSARLAVDRALRRRGAGGAGVGGGADGRRRRAAARGPARRVHPGAGRDRLPRRAARRVGVARARRLRLPGRPGRGSARPRLRHGERAVAGSRARRRGAAALHLRRRPRRRGVRARRRDADRAGPGRRRARARRRRRAAPRQRRALGRGHRPGPGRPRRAAGRGRVAGPVPSGWSSPAPATTASRVNDLVADGRRIAREVAAWRP